MNEREKNTFHPTPMMLANCVSKRFRDLMRRTGERAGIPDRYRELLRHLAIWDGRTQQELATLVGITPPSVSVTLRAMESEGYITRCTHETDQRVSLVYLTDLGHATNQKMRGFADAYDKRIMEGISEQDYEIARSVLQRMKDNLDDLRGGEEIK